VPFYDCRLGRYYYSLGDAGLRRGVSLSGLPLGQSRFRVRVLPARAAYITDIGDRRGVLRAIWEASTRWAGFSEPIIPVSEDGHVDDWWLQVAKLSDVNGLVNVNLDREVASKVACSLGLPWVGLDQIDSAGRTQFSTHPVYVRPTGELATEAAVLARAGGSLWEKVAAGELSPEQEREYTRVPGVSLRRATSGYEVAEAQVAGRCWLDVAASQFGEAAMRGNPWSVPLIVWVAEPDNIEDCLYFWNLRALRSLSIARTPILVVPADRVAAWTRLGNLLAGYLARPEVIEPDVVIRSVSVPLDELENIGQSLGLVMSRAQPERGFQIPPPPPKSPPFTFRHDIDVRQYLTSERRYGKTAWDLVQLYPDSTVISFDSPVQFTGPGHHLVRLASTAFEGIPRRPVTARLIHTEVGTEATWSRNDIDGDELELSQRAADQYQITLRIPSLDKVTTALLAAQTVDATLSDKGQLATRMGELGTADVLLQEYVIDVIDLLRTRRSRNLVRELQKRRSEGHPDEDLYKLAAEWGGRLQRRNLPLSQVKGIGDGATAAIEALCSRSWAERGMRIDCDRCKLKSFVALRRTRSQPQCPACEATGQAYKGPDGPELYYRLNSLVDRAADQGVIPHLYGVAQLAKRNPQTFMLPGIQLTLNNGDEVEVDFYGIHGGRVAVGEAKTKPEGFTEEQIERDVALSVRLTADMYLLVCPGRVPKGTEHVAKELAENAGLRLLIIDEREADRQRPEHPGGLRWSVDTSPGADPSVQISLGTPPY